MVTMQMPSPMVTPLVIYLANLTVASILVCGAALLAQRLSRRTPLPLRHTILLAGITVALASPLLVGLIQLTNCSLICVNAGPSSIVGNEQLAGNATDASRSGGPILVADQRPNDQNLDSSTGEGPVREVVDQSSPSSKDTSQSAFGLSAPAVGNVGGDWRLARSAVSWAGLGLLALWTLGSGYHLYWLLRGVRQVREFLNTVRPIDDPRICRIAKLAAESLHLKTCPGIGQSSSIEAPVSAGVLRGQVVLPSLQSSAWSDEKWTSLLLREMAHIRRRDVLVGLLQRIAIVVYWWNPLVRRVSATLSLVREQICDDLVTKHAPDAEGYAALMVDLASRVVQRRLPLAVIGAADGSPSELTSRVRRLMDRERCLVTSLEPWMVAAGSTFCLALVHSLAGVCLHPISTHAAVAGDEDGEAAPKVLKPSDSSPATDSVPSQPDGQASAKDLQGIDIPVISDLLVETNETGDQTIRFRLIAARGKRFRLNYLHTPSRHRIGHSFILESQTDDPIKVSVRFLYRPDSQGQRTGFALLGGAKGLKIRVDAPGCRDPGVTTIVDAPLPDLATEDKALSLYETSTMPGAIHRNARRVFVVRRKDSLPEIKAEEPRGELTVMWDRGDERPPVSTIVKLATLWRRQQTEIGAARIVFRQGLQSGGDFSRDQVNTLIKTVDLARDPKSLAALTLKLTSNPVQKFNANDIAHWPQTTLTVMGIKSCVRTKHALGTSVFFRNGEIDIRFDPQNRQLNAWQPGQSRTGSVGLDDLRYQPPTDSNWLKEMRVEDQPDGNVRLTTADGQRELVADPKTGFISQFLVHNGGSFVRELLFQTPKIYPGRIVFPTVSIHCDYRDDLLVSFSINVIDEAQFNESLPADAFLVVGKQGDLICDYRADRLHGHVYRLETDVPDAVQYFEKRKALADDEQAEVGVTLEPKDTELSGNKPAAVADSSKLTGGSSYEATDHRGVSARGIVLNERRDRLFTDANFGGSDFTNATILAGNRAFFTSHFSKANLSSSAITCGDGAFQKTRFDNATLVHAMLTGGVSSFQLSNFDGANLADAKLTGGAGAFQLATFVNATLNGATLSGEGGAFQQAVFNGAILDRATIHCDAMTAFQGAQLNGASFLSADLSTIPAKSLETCVFASTTPPKYNAATRFPAGFEPAKKGWQLVDLP